MRSPGLDSRWFLPLFALVTIAALAVAAPQQRMAYAASVVTADDDNDNEEESLDEFVDEVVDAINQFWADRFQQLGKPWRPPQFVQATYNQRIRSACGRSRGSDHSYCAAEETVYIDYDSDDEESFVSLWEADRSFVIVLTIGHEWGHHVQTLLSIEPDQQLSPAEQSIQSELQADCLMGVFSKAYAKTAGWVERKDLRDAIRSVRESGDDPSEPMAEDSHGTPEQRVAAFNKGYTTADTKACGV